MGELSGIPWGVLSTGSALLASNAVQAVASVFWTSAPLSLWGELFFVVIALAAANAVLLFFVARHHSVPLAIAFAIDDDPQQRILCARVNGRLTTASTMALCSVANAVAAVTSWYGTPPDRVPPIIQALLGNLIILWSVPVSKVMLGDNKVYTQAPPLLGGALLFGAVCVTLLPFFLAPGGAAAQFSGSGAGAWSVYYAVAMLPQAVALVGGQFFQWRAGAMSPTAGSRERRLVLVRMLLYNQAGVGLFLAATWWLDVLPVFGSSASVAEFRSGLVFTVLCSVGGQTGVGLAGGDVDACPPWVPVWVALFLGSYVVMLVAQAAISRESAVFNTALLLLSEVTVSLIWLIPGVNPAAQFTPWWTSVGALALSVAGVVVWKRWELGQPLEGQFRLRSIQEDNATGRKGGEVEGEEDEVALLGGEGAVF